MTPAEALPLASWAHAIGASSVTRSMQDTTVTGGTPLLRALLHDKWRHALCVIAFNLGHELRCRTACRIDACTHSRVCNTSSKGPPTEVAEQDITADGGGGDRLQHAVEHTTV